MDFKVGRPHEFSLDDTQIAERVSRLAQSKGAEFGSLKGLFVGLGPTTISYLRYKRYCEQNGVKFFEPTRISHDATIALLKDPSIEGIVSSPIELLRYARGLNGARRFAYILASGSLLLPDVAKEIRERILADGGAAYVTYGVSELGISLTRGSFAQAESEPGCVGSPCEGVELRLVDGEIYAKAPTMIAAYRDERVTEASFVDGYLRTGDRGRMNDAGLLIFEGRAGSK